MHTARGRTRGQTAPGLTSSMVVQAVGMPSESCSNTMVAPNRKSQFPGGSSQTPFFAKGNKFSNLNRCYNLVCATTALFSFLVNTAVVCGSAQRQRRPHRNARRRRLSSASGTMVGAPALPRARRALEPHQARSALLRAFGLERVRQAVLAGGGREQCEREPRAGGYAGSARGL